MTAVPARAASFLSHAELSGLLLRIPCGRAALLAELSRRHPRLRFAAGEADLDPYPLQCELWDVANGAVQLGALDQHAWSERVGRVWGSGLGLLVGAALGRGPGDPLRHASRVGAAAVSRTFSSWARAATHELSRYHEMVLSVPGVSLEGYDPSASFNLVLGMVTDSRIARSADRAFGFGYQKALGRFETSRDRSLRIASPDGGDVLSTSREHAIGNAVEGVAESFTQCVSEPLLGVLPTGRLVRSNLSRTRTEHFLVEPVAVSLSLSPTVFGEALSTSFELSALVPSAAFGAVRFSGVRAYVGYPEPV